jgi:hypothetical protein
VPWNPKQYEKFAAERYAPFEDLARLLHVRPGLRVVDLGCGAYVTLSEAKGLANQTNLARGKTLRGFARSPRGLYIENVARATKDKGQKNALEP